jgi:YVTN family beta-propeller protein
LTDLPSGTVTFLFTDIEGSTRLLRALGRERYAQALADQERLLRTAFSRSGGREIDTQGDSFFVAFPSAAEAVSAAEAAQRALAGHSWPEGREIRVRMGMHTGEPVVGEARYIGLGVHRAARICSVGHGGQVLLSHMTHDLLNDEELSEMSFKDLGERRLKDLDRPERIYQLVMDGLPADFPPLKTVDAQPEEATPFAGREQELAEAAQAALESPRRPRRRDLLLAALAGVLAAAVAIPVFALSRGNSSAPATPSARLSVGPNSVAVVNPATNRVTAAVRVGENPGPLAVDSTSVWVGNLGEDTLSHIDPKTRKVIKTIGLPVTPTALAVGGGAVWIGYNGCDAVCQAYAGNQPRIFGPAKLIKFDPSKGKFLWTRLVGKGGSGRVELTFAYESIWVSNENSGAVKRIDSETGAVQATITEKILGPKGLAAAADGVWVVDYPDSWVARIDPDTDQVEHTIPIVQPYAIGVGGAGIWVANRSPTFWRINAATNLLVRSVPVTGLGDAVAVGATGVWLAHGTFGLVSSIDPQTERTVKIRIGRPLSDIAFGAGAVWVSTR